MSTAPKVPSPVTELSTAGCWSLLETHTLGRLALVDAGGEPRIYPVNFASSDGALYIRSADDAKLRLLRSHPTVAFEIDGEDAGDRWSVVVRGDAVHVDVDAEVRRSREIGLRSMSPTPKPYVIRISPRSVTGRRFRARDGAEDPIRSLIFRPRPETLPEAARPPHPIASFTPRGGA
jgi:nitroimidazol reductase NimA-like FMN-containing flavoprotein (pyridoxamine 5'-phosphate oxidase superfamily)